jgi:hypothetical protein
MFNIFKNLPFNKKTKVNINFNDLTLKKIIKDDTWNKVKNGEIFLEYYYYDKQICHINYRLNGQIGLFYIEEDFRNVGIGKKILDNVIIDMQQHKIPYVWAITTQNHPFWHNVYKNGFTFSERPHFSVTGHGYKMNI